MLDLNAMLLNRLDNQSADIFLGIRFDYETLDVINGFAQLFQELFFVPVGSRMDKEDNACVLAFRFAGNFCQIFSAVCSPCCLRYSASSSA